MQAEGGGLPRGPSRGGRDDPEREEGELTDGEGWGPELVGKVLPGALGSQYAEQSARLTSSGGWPLKVLTGPFAYLGVFLQAWVDF